MNKIKPFNLVYKLNLKNSGTRCGGSSLSGIYFNKIKSFKLLPVLHHCVVIFFWSSGIMECTCMLFTFENGVPLMRQGTSVVWHHSLLLMNSFNKTEDMGRTLLDQRRGELKLQEKVVKRLWTLKLWLLITVQATGEILDRNQS